MSTLALQSLPCTQLPLLLRTDLVVVDVETTGWLADAAAITEIGAVRLSAGRPTAEFSELVNPGMPIPEYITALTGISDSMVGGAPAISAVLPRFMDFARGCTVVAHNAPFDVSFLTAACRQSGIGWPAFAVIDTAVLSRLVLGESEVPDHKLATLAGHFATPTAPSHRALADARATAAVLAALLGRLTGGTPTAPPPGASPPAPRLPRTRRSAPASRAARSPLTRLRRAAARALARLLRQR